MQTIFRRNLLPFSVFITGMCVLIVEVVAVRVLSPFYGSTIFTVSSVISVILAALSIGYYAGGKLADKYPSLNWFFGIILASGLVVLLFHFLSTMALPILSASLTVTAGPLISALLLFFTPALLLGTLSPYAVKLQSIRMPEQGIGSVAGKMFFWSTLGSICGSLSAGFILIPRLGINAIFVATGLTLFFLGLIPLLLFGFSKNRLRDAAAAAVILIISSSFAAYKTQGNALYSADGIYEKIAVFDGVFKNRPVRFFQQDRSKSGAMFLDSDDPADLVYEYTKYYALYKVFKPDVKNALVIGGGIYSIPKALLRELPEAEIDVSEIEPQLYEIAKKYFKLAENPRLHNYAEDGRRVLADSGKKYDLIFGDAYYSLFSIPPHLTTREFFLLLKSRLSANGVFIANLIGDLSREQPSIFFAEAKTLQSVFPNSYFFATSDPGKPDSQNIIFVGYNSEKRIDFGADSILRDKNRIIASLGKKLINLDRFDLASYPELTDNFSPVEYLTAGVLRRASRGRRAVNGPEMLAIINQLLGYGPRYIGSGGHKSAEKFLLAEMKEQTGEAIAQEWDYRGKDGKIYKLKNIIGRLYPEKKQRIILATHYDSKRFADKDAEKSSSPVPGANDSASGVAVLAEIAKILNSSHAIPNVGIDIVFFDGEEGDVNQNGDYAGWQPLGSAYFAERLEELYGNQKPLSAIVIDMVCDKNLQIYKEQSSMAKAGALVNAFWDTAQKGGGLFFKNEAGQSIQDDHTPLNKASIPSFLVIDPDYPYFHTTEDTADKCSAESLEAVASAVLKNVYSAY